MLNEQEIDDFTNVTIVLLIVMNNVADVKHQNPSEVLQPTCVYMYMYLNYSHLIKPFKIVKISKNHFMQIQSI